MRKEPIKVRWVDTLNVCGIHRSRLVATECRRGSKYEGFANFSATPPLELVKLIISLVATARRDPESWFATDQIAMMHTDICRAFFRVPSKEEKYVELPPESRQSEYSEYGRLRVSRQSFDGTRLRSRSRKSVFILLQRTWDQGRRAWRRFLVWRTQIAIGMVGKK